MLTALHQQVRRTIRRYQLLPQGSRVLVALSGGSDSVALAALLKDLSEHGPFEVVGVAHLNHGLRDTAGRDEAFCGEVAASLGLPLYAEQADVMRFSAGNKLSIEDAARKIRYAFLNRQAESVGADRIAVGHTRDDQAETFLMKLMRGAGTAGLGAIYPSRGAVVRPLLDSSRRALRAFLTARNLTWMEDETNLDVENPRNRIRLQVLPELARALNGDPAPAIARAAALIREDGEWLDGLAQREFDALAEQDGNTLTFDVSGLRRLPAPIEARVLRTGLIRLAGDEREVTQDHVETVRSVLRGESGGVDVPNGRVELSGRKLVLIERRAAPK